MNIKRRTNESETIYTPGLNKGFCSKLQHILPEEGQRLQRPIHLDYGHF